MNMRYSLTLNELKHQHDNSCQKGTYRIERGRDGRLSWDSGCSGYKKCDKGYYCTENDYKRHPCPAGTYGNKIGLITSICSGLCPEGHYCPIQTINGYSYRCGIPSLYCPLGSSKPLIVPNGYYSLNKINDTGGTMQSDIRICEAGSYCENGIKYKCPAGTYGNTNGLSSSSCSGFCEEGFYCPIGSVSSKQKSCGSDSRLYCPKGSKQPLHVGLGYYATTYYGEVGGGFGDEMPCTPGYYCQNGRRMLCPAGRYGLASLEINSSCTGACMAGWYCPEGSTSKFEKSCGDPGVYCGPESATPLFVDKGYYSIGSLEDKDALEIVNYHQGETRTLQTLCDPGYYCIGDGYKRKCPAGRYGSDSGLTQASCSGICEAGYYCPEMSITPKAMECGDSTKFCPEGSHASIAVQNGYYTIHATTLYLYGLGDRFQIKERKCPPGSYCINGRKYLCDAGYWGSEFGLNVSTCSGICNPGYYCPEGSTSPTEFMCGDAGFYCTEGAYKPTKVSLGYYSTGGTHSTRTGQQMVLKGSYAVEGIRYICPSGYYGSKDGLQNPTCSGVCDVAGFYCPEGSISPTQRVCGGDNVYCPPGSTAPIKVSPGFYTADYTSRNDSLRGSCPPGKWRNWTGLSYDATVNNSRSPIDTFKSVPACQLCRLGTYKATAGDDLSSCLSCPNQSNSTNDRVRCNCLATLSLTTTDSVYFNLTTAACEIITVEHAAANIHDNYFSNMKEISLLRYTQSECEPGFYCKDGIRYSCTPGRYGSKPRETNSQCEGLCTAGYYCHEASTSNKQISCGKASLFCPKGSSAPSYVSAGFYSDESEQEHTRSRELPCPPGYFCSGGKFDSASSQDVFYDGLRHKCPAGRYSDELRTSSIICKDVCEDGYYCKEGSSNSKEFQCGGSNYYCPRGSTEPNTVHEGFYCSHSGSNAGTQALFDPKNETCSVEVPCEPGYYCKLGAKYPCPPGKFGWRYGMTDAYCGGDCAAGYYCPSYIAMTPDAPSHTVWPAKPHTFAAELECGAVDWYCPKGSHYPTKVSGGYYTIGGDSDGKSRSAQVICPRGSYCENGIQKICPQGRYGNTEGLTTIECSGWCPPAHYCPQNTSDPIPCPLNKYATGASYECYTCPGSDTDIDLPCQYDRKCCFQAV